MSYPTVSVCLFDISPPNPHHFIWRYFKQTGCDNNSTRPLSTIFCKSSPLGFQHKHQPVHSTPSTALALPELGPSHFYAAAHASCQFEGIESWIFPTNSLFYNTSSVYPVILGAGIACCARVALIEHKFVHFGQMLNESKQWTYVQMGWRQHDRLPPALHSATGPSPTQVPFMLYMHNGGGHMTHFSAQVQWQIVVAIVHILAISRQ
jgi:hypothetical protein